MTTETKFANDTVAQCRRLLAELRLAGGKGVTSYHAFHKLGIYHPPARIMYLRRRGFNIITARKTIEEHLCKPRSVGLYILISENKGAAL